MHHRICGMDRDRVSVEVLVGEITMEPNGRAILEILGLARLRVFEHLERECFGIAWNVEPGAEVFDRREHLFLAHLELSRLRANLPFDCHLDTLTGVPHEIVAVLKRDFEFLKIPSVLYPEHDDRLRKVDAIQTADDRRLQTEHGDTIGSNV